MTFRAKLTLTIQIGISIVLVDAMIGLLYVALNTRVQGTEAVMLLTLLGASAGIYTLVALWALGRLWFRGAMPR